MPEFTFAELAEATHGVLLNIDDPSGKISSVFTDTREKTPDSLFVALSGENFDAHNYLAEAVGQGAQILCVEKSKADMVPTGVPALLVESTLAAYQDIASFHRRRFPALKVIALTGSCGKTSTKEALRAIFVQAFGADKVLATEGNTNNQIGVPRNLLRLNGEHEFAIIEMGTNHHGEIEPLVKCALPCAALVVSIASCHLEFLGSLDGVAREKSHIFMTLGKDGFGVIPFDCAGKSILLDAVKNFSHAEAGMDPSADFYSIYGGGNLHGASFELVKRATGERVKVEWGIPGRHQASNAAAAAAMADHFGIDMSTTGAGLSHTVLPGMRMRITERDGVTWINDAYNANPDSMKASLTWLSEFADASKLLLVLGDMVELGEDSLKRHAEILSFARNLFPDARILAVGKKMTLAASDDMEVFPDSAACAEKILSFVRRGGMVFLKASRMTKLELCEK